jgi:16S rRNA (guanine1207-N2)-methyltransferase
VSINGEPIALCSKPGVPNHRNVDDATVLLAQLLQVDHDDTVLNFNGGAGLVGVVAARLAADGRVLLADANVVEVEAARKTLDANGVRHAEVHLSSGTSHLTLASPVDVVVARLPKGRLPTLQLIWDAFQALAPGGRFYIAGANDEGIQSALGRVEVLFGNARVLAYRKGCRVGLAVKSVGFGLTPGPSPSLMERGESRNPVGYAEEFRNPLLDHGRFHQYSVELRGRTYVVCSRPGVFSWEKLDPGTRALIDAMEIKPGEDVLDLGCGTGIVGVVVANLSDSGTVHIVDADVDAVDSATRTVRVNGSPKCVVLASDSTSAVRDVRFDVVVTNPPFHLAKTTEYDVALQFVEDSAGVLRKSGRLYVVANQFLPYESHLRRFFARVDTIFADKHYKVLRAASGWR